MKYNKILLAALAIALTTVSCKKDFENPVEDTTYTSGQADFSTYVALGNSLTAGYSDGALYSSAQKQSYPSIVAAAMMMAGGGEFNQPLMPNDVGGFANLGLSGKLQLKMVNGSLSPVPSAPGGDLDAASGGPFQNLGVPGAKGFHLLAPGYGSAAGLAAGLANPYYVRFTTGATASVLSDAMAQEPTFFSLWAGNNDVLGYATTGGTGDTITSVAFMDQVLQGLVSQLTANGAKGVIANIPSITDIPFFTTVPYKFIPLRDGQVDSLNGSPRFSALFQVIRSIDPNRDISYVKGEPNRMLIKDNSLPDISAQIADSLAKYGIGPQEAQAMGMIYGQARMTVPGDLVLLTAMSTVGTLDPVLLPVAGPAASVIGVTAPTDALVLDAGEQASISSAISGYNQAIAGVASAFDLALYDANSMMSMLASESGLSYNGVDYTTAFVTGGAFSLDGVHPTPRGYAIIANGFIDAINNKYGSNLPFVNPNDYSGVKFP